MSTPGRRKAFKALGRRRQENRARMNRGLKPKVKVAGKMKTVSPATLKRKKAKKRVKAFVGGK